MLMLGFSDLMSRASAISKAFFLAALCRILKSFGYISSLSCNSLLCLNIALSTLCWSARDFKLFLVYPIYEALQPSSGHVNWYTRLVLSESVSFLLVEKKEECFRLFYYGTTLTIPSASRTLQCSLVMDLIDVYLVGKCVDYVVLCTLQY